DPNRRHPHAVSGFQPVLRLDPPLVDPHLPLAQQAVNAGLGHPLEAGDKEVVDPLPGLVVGYGIKADASTWIGSFSHDMTPAWGPIAEGGDSTSWRIIEEIHFIFAISLIKK